MADPRCANEPAEGPRHLPPVAGTAWCFGCSPDPEVVARRREKASNAAKASHARRADPAVTRWSDTITGRLKTPADAREIAAEALALTASGGLSTSQATAIERLIGAWLKGYALEHPKGKPEGEPTRLVPMMSFAKPGQGPGSGDNTIAAPFAPQTRTEPTRRDVTDA